jgi:hypothetical protein
MIAPSSLNLEPMLPPCPALFSRISQVCSGVSASTLLTAPAIWVSDWSNPAPLWLPMWKITPRAPDCPQNLRYCLSEPADRPTSAGSAEARLIR